MPFPWIPVVFAFPAALLSFLLTRVVFTPRKYRGGFTPQERDVVLETSLTEKAGYLVGCALVCASLFVIFAFVILFPVDICVAHSFRVDSGFEGLSKTDLATVWMIVYWVSQALAQLTALFWSYHCTTHILISRRVLNILPSVLVRAALLVGAAIFAVTLPNDKLSKATLFLGFLQTVFTVLGTVLALALLGIGMVRIPQKVLWNILPVSNREDRLLSRLVRWEDKLTAANTELRCAFEHAENARALIQLNDRFMLEAFDRLLDHPFAPPSLVIQHRRDPSSRGGGLSRSGSGRVCDVDEPLLAEEAGSGGGGAVSPSFQVHSVYAGARQRLLFATFERDFVEDTVYSLHRRYERCVQRLPPVGTSWTLFWCLSCLVFLLFAGACGVILFCEVVAMVSVADLGYYRVLSRALLHIQADGSYALFVFSLAVILYLCLCTARALFTVRVKWFSIYPLRGYRHTEVRSVLAIVSLTLWVLPALCYNAILLLTPSKLSDPSKDRAETLAYETIFVGMQAFPGLGTLVIQWLPLVLVVSTASELLGLPSMVRDYYKERDVEAETEKTRKLQARFHRDLISVDRSSEERRLQPVSTGATPPGMDSGHPQAPMARPMSPPTYESSSPPPYQETDEDFPLPTVQQLEFLLDKETLDLFAEITTGPLSHGAKVDYDSEQSDLLEYDTSLAPASDSFCHVSRAHLGLLHNGEMCEKRGRVTYGKRILRLAVSDRFLVVDKLQKKKKKANGTKWVPISDIYSLTCLGKRLIIGWTKHGTSDKQKLLRLRFFSVQSSQQWDTALRSLCSLPQPP